MEPLTQERAAELLAEDDPAVWIAEVERRDKNIDALVREGRWQETQEERAALRGWVR